MIFDRAARMAQSHALLSKKIGARLAREGIRMISIFVVAPSIIPDLPGERREREPLQLKFCLFPDVPGPMAPHRPAVQMRFPGF